MVPPIASRSGRLVLMVAVLLVVSLAPAAAAATPQSSEVSVPGSALPGDGVRESYVSLSSPMPAAAPAHPAACDRIGYLRVRAQDGPENPEQADTIYVIMPGILAGAGSLEPTARNIVRAATQTGRHVEVWALDRRSNCLEDHAGLAAAAQAKDATVAFNYYFAGQPVDGLTYAGPASPADAAFLNDVGLAQTVQDYHAVLAQLPAQVRQQKVMCGGHSLGGPIVGALANWDFDGTPGYTLCAGYFTLDSRLSMGTGAPGLAELQAMLPVGVADLFAGLRAGSPYINMPPLSPATFAMLGVLTQAAALAPDERSAVLSRIPHDLNFEVALRLFGARDWGAALSGTPDLRQLDATNAAVLGIVLDDNSSPISILRGSFGAPTGGPVVAKSFPLPYGAPSAGVVGGNKLVSPSDPQALYRWLNYDQLPPAGPTTTDGDHYTTPASEVTDVHQLAAAFGAPSADGTEWYFPIRLLTDLTAIQLGDRHGSLANFEYDGISKRPAIYLDAGDSGLETGMGVPAGSTQVVLPGYNHIDVGTAAWKQNNGQPEPLSHALVDFVASHVAR